jgi:CheY-like chemotaxis protein
MSTKKETNITITHDLLSPLNVILGLTQVLSKDNSLNSHHIEMIESIQKAGKKLSSQLQKIFDIPVNETEMYIDNKKIISCSSIKPPIKVLIVDDIAINRYLIKNLLSQYSDLIIDEAGDFQSVMDQLKERKPHIVLMDIYMPDMNGFEILQRIRKDTSNHDIFFVMMSSDTKDLHKEQMAACHVDAFISKPIQKENLFSLFKQFFPDLIENNNKEEFPVATQLDKIPDENILQELIRLARQGAYSEIKNLMEQIKTKQSEFISFIRYLEALLKKFQFKEMIDWINSSKKTGDEQKQNSSVFPLKE